MGLALIDQINYVRMDLEKVDGTLCTMLSLGDEDSLAEPPSHKQVMGLLQLLADVVSPACEELDAIVKQLAEAEKKPSFNAKKRR